MSEQSTPNERPADDSNETAAVVQRDEAGRPVNVVNGDVGTLIQVSGDLTIGNLTL